MYSITPIHGCAGILDEIITMLRALLLLFVVATVYSLNDETNDVWIWQCQEEKCVRVRADQGNEGESLARCHITCGTYASMWPYPTDLKSLSTTAVTINIEKMKIEKKTPSEGVDALVDGAIERFKEGIQEKNVHSEAGNSFSGSINIEEDTTSVYMETEESYELTIKQDEGSGDVQFTITAKTYFGARHALETLAQLIVYDDKEGSYLTVQEATIHDKPVFKHRGMLLDTSRHFYSMDSIKKLIDGLSMNKLNTFHWHITDSHSWPLIIPNQPNMTAFGAYSADQVYSPENVKEIVEYARERGVRVLPEIDAPYHVSNGFQWTNEMGRGDVILCDHLNPLNDFMYDLLSDFYAHSTSIFDLDAFHMGADEVIISCWNSSEEIRNWIVEQGMDITDPESFYSLWSVFQTEANKRLTAANGGKELPNIVWTSDLTHSPNVERYLDNQKFTIQVWTTAQDPTMGNLLSKGFKLIISNYDAWYLDCGFGNYCGYETWAQVYDNSPFGLIHQFGYTCEAGGQWDPECDLVLGGETCMWSELVDASSVEMKVWPKTAAVAERLWSNPSTGSGAATTRLLRQRHRMTMKGINADAIMPELCDVNETC